MHGKRRTDRTQAYMQRPPSHRIQVVGHAVLMLLGFKRHEINGIAYWYRSCPRNLSPKGDCCVCFSIDQHMCRCVAAHACVCSSKLSRPHAQRTERSLPLVFFHGISPGLNMYLTLVHTLSKNRKAVLVSQAACTRETSVLPRAPTAGGRRSVESA